jgi:hypothetical protein
MSAPIRRTARSFLVLAAVSGAVLLSAGPAAARPDPGAPVAEPTVAATVVAGCDLDAAWPVYPGWRGPCLPPQLRGSVLEFLDS